MSGLRRICKAYGQMQVGNTLWLWDYAADEPVTADEMPIGSERWKASERARFRAFTGATNDTQEERR